MHGERAASGSYQLADGAVIVLALAGLALEQVPSRSPAGLALARLIVFGAGRFPAGPLSQYLACVASPYSTGQNHAVPSFWFQMALHREVHCNNRKSIPKDKAKQS